MARTVSELIKLAEAEVGYLEKKSNSQLDSKTGNAGKNNYTKYARDLHKAGYYQASKQGLAWCDMFVDWLFLQLCDGDAVAAEAMICQIGDYGAGCTYSAKYYKNKGRFFDDPKPGDQIFFWNSKKDGDAHTGLVTAVDKTYVYTIEGNTSTASGVVANGGGVCAKKYKLTNSRIHGYGRPYYDTGVEIKTETTTETKTETTTSKEASTVNIELPVLKMGAKGETVKALQRMLYAMGYNLGDKPIDGSFGPKVDAAVRSYQKKHKMEVDGSVGPKTWTKLLKG